MNAKKANASKKKAPSVLEEAYDDVPYESLLFAQTHPDRMSVVAKVFGLTPVDIHKARVLEIGCASGGNIIPLAMRYPKAKFLGVDLSGEQIAHAEKNKKAMGIKNIDFLQKDIAKLGKDAGEFDYIICHGVFSWVPATVRDSILEVCRKHLSKNGLALISFNVLPGWASIKSLREMMMFHVKNFKDPAQQIHESKMLLNFLYENTPTANEPYRQIIDRERQILNKTHDSYMFHEHLESENHQFYLHEFADMALKNKLAYVGDSELSTMYLGNLSPNAQKTLGAIQDIIQQEQYIDFLLNRRFRYAILTPIANADRINRNLSVEKIFDFYVQARFRLDASKPGQENNITFTGVGGGSFVTQDRNSAIVFKALAEKNRPVKIDDLAAELKITQKLDPEATKTVFAKNGFPLVLQSFLSLHGGTYKFATQVSNKPKASRWVHHLASTSKKTHGVTNLKDENITLEPFAKTMVPYLDGKNTKDDIIDKMTKHVLDDELKIHKENKKITDAKEVREIMKQQVDLMLEKFASLALLEG